MLEFLPRGGRLSVAVGGQEHALWLPERRFALVVSLLDPPRHAGGEVVPDEIVLARVWPRQPHKSRVDLNVLVARLRRDLEEASLSTQCVVRAPGGGGTRFPLAPGAEVVVR
ncbi:MAG: winged helix-turn-helix domain-containing protein [Myxococcota bacterium]